MFTIDGSTGEGGGQMLRTSLALSLVTGTPVRVVNIRAGRAKPGLMRQHLTAVQAAAAISGAAVEGAAVGATAIAFRPGAVRGGDHRFSVGTAGSATLVLQTILPALITAAEPTTLILEGGTHNPHAPPFDFLARAFLPLLRRMGPRVDVVLEKPGFYPAGGGRLRVAIEPTAALAGFELLERGALRARRARAIVASLPRSIAERELEVIGRRLGWDARSLRAEVVENGPGNVVIVELESEHASEVCTGFGERGVPAETIADAVADEALAYLDAGVPVGVHLADQLLLPLALAGGGAFRTLAPSSHTRTQADVIRSFLGLETTMTPLTGAAWHLQVAGRTAGAA